MLITLDTFIVDDDAVGLTILTLIHLDLDHIRGTLDTFIVFLVGPKRTGNTLVRQGDFPIATGGAPAFHYYLALPTVDLLAPALRHPLSRATGHALVVSRHCLRGTGQTTFSFQDLGAAVTSHTVVLLHVVVRRTVRTALLSTPGLVQVTSVGLSKYTPVILGHQ